MDEQMVEHGFPEETLKDHSSGALERTKARSRKLAVGVSVALLVALVAGVAGWVYTGPARAYDHAYSEYEAAFETHSKLATDAREIAKACEENTDLVADMPICTDFEKAWGQGSKVKKLAELKQGARGEFKSAASEAQQARETLVALDKKLDAALKAAKSDLKAQAVAYRESADKTVAEWEAAAKQDRADAQAMKDTVSDEGPRAELLKQLDVLDQAISEYKALGVDAYAAVLKAALENITAAGEAENAAYTGVLAVLPIEATPESVKTTASSGVQASRSQARASAARPGVPASNSGTPTYSGNTNTSGSSGGSHSGGGSNSGGGSSSGGSSSGGSSSSGGYTAGDWVPDGTWNEVDGNAVGSDGSICFEELMSGGSRQVPCD